MQNNEETNGHQLYSETWRFIFNISRSLRMASVCLIATFHQNEVKIWFWIRRRWVTWHSAVLSLMSNYYLTNNNFLPAKHAIIYTMLEVIPSDKKLLLAHRIAWATKKRKKRKTIIEINRSSEKNCDGGLLQNNISTLDQMFIESRIAAMLNVFTFKGYCLYVCGGSKQHKKIL